MKAFRYKLAKQAYIYYIHIRKKTSIFCARSLGIDYFSIDLYWNVQIT